MEVRGVAWQNYNAAGRIRLQLVAIELIAEADVEDTGYNCVDSILWVSVWHQLHAMGHFDPDRVGARLRGLTNNDSEANQWWKRRERLPVDLFGQNRIKSSLT